MKWGTVARHVFLILVTLVILVPFFWILLVALKPLEEAIAYPPTFFPAKPTLSNFRYVILEYRDMRRFYANSIVVTGIVVPTVTTITCLAGYAFGRLRFPGRDKMFWGLVATMFFPLGFARLFTIFEMTHKLRLLDTRLGLILPYTSMGIVMYTFIMRQNFLEIPPELEDAARVDGCSIIQTFLRIMLPLTKNAIAVVAVLAFVNVWGEFLYANTLTLEEARTLPVGLSMITQTTSGETAFNMLAAAYSLAILPPLVLFIGSQRLFMRGLTAGALKF